MIKHTNQQWIPGQQVKVGFLSLTVIGNIGSQIKGSPEAYRLINPRTNKTYLFTPYNGLERETIDPSSTTPEEKGSTRT